LKKYFRVAENINNKVESIGARRLYTVLEKVFDEISYSAPDLKGEKITINEGFVKDNLKNMGESKDEENLIL